MAQTSSQTGYYTPAASCHSGNTELISLPKTGGGLYFGGLSHSVVTAGHVVIDLTGSHILNSAGDVRAMNVEAEQDFANAISKAQPVVSHAWLRVPIKDYGVPANLDREFWDALRDDIYALMKAGEKVVVFCQGGHGRTGMAAAILCFLLNPKAIGDDPIQWVRDRYCTKAVETAAQVKYVHEILGLPEPDTTKYIKPSTTVYSAGYQGWTGTYQGQTDRKAGKLDTIVNELYKNFIWNEEADDHVLARRLKGDMGLVKLVSVSGTTDYVTSTGEIISRLALMTELEEKKYQETLEDIKQEQEQLIHGEVVDGHLEN